MKDNSIKTKALLLGGYNVPYHPLTGIIEQLEVALSDRFEITIAVTNDVLATDLSQYELLISYADQWDKTLTDLQTAGLVSFVVKGGGLLTLHNGICLASRHEIKSIIGASFNGHPDSEVLPFSFESDNSLTYGIESFEMHEEPYQYNFTDGMKLQIFMEYTYQGDKKPSGWQAYYGLGKTIYLHPGHSVSNFQNANYLELIRRCANWCVE